MATPNNKKTNTAKGKEKPTNKKLSSKKDDDIEDDELDEDDDLDFEEKPKASKKSASKKSKSDDDDDDDDLEEEYKFDDFLIKIQKRLRHNFRMSQKQNLLKFKLEFSECLKLERTKTRKYDLWNIS